MLPILQILQHTIIYYKLETKSKKRIYSDNKGFIERINQIQHKKIIPPRRCMLSESDIELQIWVTLQTLNTNSILQHVLGHQEQGETTPLTWQAPFNIRCNELASNTLTKIKEIKIIPMTTRSKIMLEIDEETITHHYAPQIRHLATRQHSIDYHTTHHGKSHKFTDIDWELLRSCYKDLPFYDKLFITKWTNKLLPLNYQRHRHNLFPTPQCPCCHEIETDRHLIECKQKERQEHKLAFIEILTKIFKKQDTDPDLRIIILQTLNKKTTPKRKSTDNYVNIKNKQTQVGKISLHYGFYYLVSRLFVYNFLVVVSIL